ncbi:MFS transporter [Leptolyngbya sp. FACHB-321]|uniref:MFS transporter n=1 Tax=Leptolyngbya sp. FACHB-321 TaxID=2692807 RepID=UPI0016870CD8|nr:MFS transporter [Leptolyngbya sp. FACHB-321]MBD2038484.1 MFS transporter [Leptolyngbya sp. FACHB-321]
MNFGIERLKPMLRALRSRNYRLFFLGQGASLIGTWMTQTATIWLVYHLTGSALMLGLVGFANQFPNFVLTPFAGVWVDRWDRRRTIIITQVLAMMQSLSLAFLALTGTIEVWQIVVLAAFQGSINAFDMPARQSFVVKMVDRRDDLSNAIALNSSMFSSARLVGPAIAGLIIAATNTGVCFLIDGVSYIAVIAGLLAMRLPPEPPVASKPAETIWYSLKEGFDYAFGLQPIRSILLLIALVSLVGMPYMTLAPIFASEILHGGPETLGFLMASSGLGALIAAVYLSARPNALGLSKLIAIAPAIFGSALIVFALSRVLWLSMLAVLLIGMGLVLQHTSGNTVLQTIVDDDKRGRVMSFYMMAFTSTVTFGNLVAGSLATHIGAPNTLLLGGILCISGSLLFTKQLPEMRRSMRLIYRRIGLLPQPDS